MDNTKPPLGLMPKHIHDQSVTEMRIRDILAVVNRYLEEGKEIDSEWIFELSERLLKRNKILNSVNNRIDVRDLDISP